MSERRLELFDALLGLFPPGRLIDLGAGHGSFSVRATERGWKATAVDARTKRFQDDPRVDWVNLDVREAHVSGYDLILCLGLLYHLTLEDQLHLLNRASGTPLIIDTHVANGTNTKNAHRLSDLMTIRGYEGQLFREGDATSPTASWGNEESFWPTPEAFYRMLGESRYRSVLAATPWYQPDRTFFLCIPS
ncbi:MAG: class I SAM-dependent methyltransferase [Actinomycetota bacterium]|nr:class I SAM-dependent methyltransferase [Actinomycetota bacterium]